MSSSPNKAADNSSGAISSEVLLPLLKARFEAADRHRRGVCLLNSGQYAEAEQAFRKASAGGYTDKSLPSYLAACLLGRGDPGGATEQFATVVKRSGPQVAARIRQSLSTWAEGKCDDAIELLREGIHLEPECAELHYHLGTLLTSLDRYEEAELRFTQAVNLDPNHTEALVSLGLCCGVRNAPVEAQVHLQRAQVQRPHDARIGMLLSKVAKAVQEQGIPVRVHAKMPDENLTGDDRGIEELSQVIESEPDFVDAFLAIPDGRVDSQIFVLLLETLQSAIRRNAEHAELHFQYSRILARLGSGQDAISENERAVEIKPTFVRALIELAKLYQQTDRNADATSRLEQAIAAGAQYADVYYLLGNLYRDQGQVGRAHSAYRHALLLNDSYEAALQALEALPTA